MTVSPTDAQREMMNQALLEHEHIDQVGDEFTPGLAGYQVLVHLTDVDDYRFNVYVEDVEANCSWCIVQLKSGRYEPDFPDDGLVAVVEVDRFPPLPEP